jgi:hypothetical protein
LAKGMELAQDLILLTPEGARGDAA